MATVINHVALNVTARKQRHNCEFEVISQNGKHAVIEITTGEFKGSRTDSISVEDPAFSEGKADFYVGTRQGKAYLQADTAFTRDRNAINRVITTTSGGAIKSVQTLDQFSSLSASRQEALLKLTTVLSNKQGATPNGFVRKEVSEGASAELGG